MRKATKLDFASWGGFAQNFSQRRIPFEHPEAAAAWNSAPAESLFIPTFAADHRGAYLPGSALKGALRTSIVFSRWTAGTIDRIAAAVSGERAPRRLAEPAEVSSGASQVKIISVADSQPLTASAFKIFLTRVASLDTRQTGTSQLSWKVAGRGSVSPQRMSEATPVFAEMAPPGSGFVGEWDERVFLENPELTHALGWRFVPQPKQILDAANEHAAAQLELHARYAEVTGLEGLRNTIQGLSQELLVSRESPGTCLLCLGWGSGFLSKVGYLQTEQEPYRRILRAVAGFGKAIREGVPFPKTRRIVFTDAKPVTLPGWVKVHFEQ